MHQLTVVVCLLVTLGVTTIAGQGIPGVNEDLITDLFGTPPPDEATDEPLVTEEDECTCVQWYQCKNKTLNEYGEGLLDIRSGKRCSNTLHQCCFPEDQGGQNKWTLPTVDPPTTPRHRDRIVKTGCGIRNAHGVGFQITGATDGESNFGEFPWMVALMVKEEHSLVYKCGGSLIHHQVVLTAAHCVDKVDPYVLMVRAGEWDTQSIDEPFAYQQSAVDSVIIHENFYKGDLRNDIALVVFSKPIATAPHIGFVCLPTQGEVVDSSECYASGWGKENFGQSSHYQSLLKSIELPIMPRDKCTRAFRTTRLGKFFKLHSSFICAGGQGKDTCKGDGGGPLVCPMNSERYLLAGIVAWGIGCGDQGVPGAYASVAMFRDWIDQKMAAEGYGTDTYTEPEPNLYE